LINHKCQSQFKIDNDRIVAGSTIKIEIRKLELPAKISTELALI
jgi:hypothetical protein